jgi:cellulase
LQHWDNTCVVVIFCHFCFWIKIDEFDQTDGKSANENMHANNMTYELKLPTGSATGEYLLRSEMLALHSA